MKDRRKVVLILTDDDEEIVNSVSMNLDVSDDWAYAIKRAQQWADHFVQCKMLDDAKGIMDYCAGWTHSLFIFDGTDREFHKIYALNGDAERYAESRFKFKFYKSIRIYESGMTDFEEMDLTHFGEMK